MRVVHISQTDTCGGAGIASYRLHQGLRQSGVDSVMLVGQKASEDDSVTATGSRDGDDISFAAIETSYIRNNRTALSNSHFSLSLTDSNLAQDPLIVEADVLHLHWVPGLLTPNDIGKIFRLGKPVFWTLHDMNPFTGGCHFAAGCRGFEVACETCPQLEEDPFNLTAAVLADKQAIWNLDTLTLICPSHWIASEARESQVFRDHTNIEIIPNCIDTRKFKENSRTEARRQLGISSSGLVILIAAESADEKRKGFRELSEILRFCCASEEFLSCQPTLLQVGHLQQWHSGVPIAVVDIGWVDSEEKLAMYFAACDFFILPSLEDNLPNMAIEAACCGLPICGFETGGISELVKNGETGFLVSPDDPDGMARKIISLALDPEMREKMGINSAAFARDTFGFSTVVPMMTGLYVAATEKSEEGAACFSSTDSTEIPNLSPGPSVVEILPELTAHSQTKEMQRLNQELSRLQQICNERQQVIDELCSEIEMLRNECRRRLELIEHNKSAMDKLSDLWRK